MYQHLRLTLRLNFKESFIVRQLYRQVAFALLGGTLFPFSFVNYLLKRRGKDDRTSLSQGTRGLLNSYSFQRLRIRVTGIFLFITLQFQSSLRFVTDERLV